MILLTGGGGRAWLLPGGHAWLLGGVCMVALGGHVWFLPGGMHGFCRGGMHGFCWGGVCGFCQGGVHGFCWGTCVLFAGGMRAFCWGCVCFFPGGHMRRIRRDTVNERAVRILLECILAEAAKALRPMSVDLLLKHGARVDIGHLLHLFGDPDRQIFDPEIFYNKDYLTVGAQLIRHGAVLDVSVPSGWGTVDNLLYAHGDIGNAGERLGTDLLRLILRENAIKLPRENSTVTVELISDADYDMFFDYYILSLSTYLYELRFTLKLMEKILKDEEKQEELDMADRELVENIKEIKRPNLQRFCRISIRRALGSPLSVKLAKLNLPNVIEDYLFMLDV